MYDVAYNRASLGLLILQYFDESGNVGEVNRSAPITIGLELIHSTGKPSNEWRDIGEIDHPVEAHITQ